MQIFFNGQPREIPEDATVAGLLEQWQLNPRHVAVELNLHVTPRAEYARQRLAAGDRLEVVTLTGGG